MKSRVVRIAVGILFILICRSTAAFAAAVAPGSSAAAFVPATSADGAVLTNIGSEVYNTSATASALVVADLGTASGLTANYIFYGKGNGNNVVCQVNIYDYVNNTLNSWSGNKAVVGTYNIPIAVPLNTGGFLSAECRIPNTSASGSSYIYGTTH